jgi:hypothetical protein
MNMLPTIYCQLRVLSQRGISPTIARAAVLKSSYLAPFEVTLTYYQRNILYGVCYNSLREIDYDLSESLSLAKQGSQFAELNLP